MQMPEMFDNVSKTVKDDLTVTIKGRQAVRCGACFSIYAYQALKSSLMALMSCALFSPHRHFCERKTKKNGSSTSRALVANVPLWYRVRSETEMN